MKNRRRLDAIMNKVFNSIVDEDDYYAVDNEWEIFSDRFDSARAELDREEKEQRVKENLKRLRLKARPGRLEIESDDDDDFELSPDEREREKLLRAVQESGGTDDQKIGEYLAWANRNQGGGEDDAD